MIDHKTEFIEIDELTFLIDSTDISSGEMNWNKANNLVKEIGNNSRLPTKDELKMIFENKDKIPNLNNFDAYWSSENSDNPETVYGKQGTAWSLTLYSGILTELGKSRYKCLVRLVKDKI
tara:strand:+ start:48 stop:407 length:360 start_codon:yes stop_codon:yes gene_type:complete